MLSMKWLIFIVIYPWPNVSSDFGIAADVENDYHVKEVQDMINVIQRMIKDGKAFYQQLRCLGKH